MADGEKKEQPFDQLSKILRNNDLTKTEFTNLAHEHADKALTKEVSRSNVGGMSHFNCLYQMKLALISRLHEDLQSFKPKQVGTSDSSEEEEDEIKISDQVSDALCDNFDLVNQVLRSDGAASSQIIDVLLDSIGALDLNGLSHEPSKALNKLEDILQALLLETIDSNDSTNLDIMRLAVELALTRSSAQRLLTMIETLLRCNKTKDLSFGLPETLLRLAQRVRSSNLYPPNDTLLVDEYALDTTAKSTAHSMVSDGKYLWMYGTFGLLKVGTGYHDTVKSKIYAHNDKFYNNDGKCNGCLILLLNGTKSILLFRSTHIEPHCFMELDINSLQHTRYVDYDDDNNYFAGMDDGEWLKTYSPSFSNGKYLSVLRRRAGGEIEVVQFDPTSTPNYSFAHCVALRGPQVQNAVSLGGCYGSGGNMAGEFGLGHNTRQAKPILLDWTRKCGSFKQIAGGNQWHAYLTQTGELYVAGQNSSGQCGLGHTQQVKIAQLHEFYKKEGRVAMVGDGVYSDHMIVLMENGHVWSHGSGYNSQLGYGEDGSKTSPIRVTGLDQLKIVFVAADNRVSVFLTDRGEVYTCGFDDYGVLGHGKDPRRVKVPTKVEALQGVVIVYVSHSYTHMLLLDDGGQVYSAGQNSYGQLGHGHKTNHRDVPKKIEYFMEINCTVRKVSAGYYHSACLTTEDKCYMWGYASNYALGTEQTTHEATPVIPGFFADIKVTDVVCGGFHTIWLTDKNELYSSGSNSYGECMIGKNGTVRVPTLCETLKDQQIVSINTGLYTSLIQTENTEVAMHADALEKATFMSAANSIAMTVPSGVCLGVTDEAKDVDMNTARMRIFGGAAAGMKMFHQKDVVLSQPVLSCYESMTNCVWTLDAIQGMIKQYFSLKEGGEISAKDLIQSPSTPDTILMHPQFVIPSVAGELCQVTRIVVALIAQLHLMATKQQGDWKTFVIGHNQETFKCMFAILRECWEFLKNADSNSNQKQDSKQLLFYGVLLQSIFGLLQVNIEHLPSKIFETEGVLLFARAQPNVKQYFCEISLALSRSIDAEIGSNIVIRANDREIALQVKELHHGDDEQIYISKAYGLANLCIEDNTMASIDVATTAQAKTVTLRAIHNDLKALPDKFREDERYIKKLYVEEYFTKDIVITKQTVIIVKAIRKNKIDFEDEMIKTTLKLQKDDTDLDNLPDLRFKIDAIEESKTQSSNKTSHYIVNAESCEFVIDLKPKTDEKEEDIYFLESNRKIKQQTMDKLCSLLEEIITYPNSDQYKATFKAVYDGAKTLYKHGYRAFFTTDYARCHHLYKWMDLHIKGLEDNKSQSLIGIERLLTTAIEILKETPQVSYLFYPKVAHEFGRNKATIISHDMLDEEEADAWLTKFVKSEQVRAEFLDNWSSANVEGTGRINWVQLQRILKIKDDDQRLDEFKLEIGDDKALDFYDYAACALLIKNGIAVDRPLWAKKKDIEATHTTFIPQISSKALQTLVSFIDGHTTSNMGYIIQTKQIPKQLNPSNPELQTMALKLVVSVLNDLIRRSLAAGADNKPLDRFPPLSQFISMVFETTFRFLRKSRDAQSILSPQSVTKDMDAFVSYNTLDESIYKLIMNSNNLQVVLPYLVTNLTVLISNGWSHIRDLGQLALNLIAEMNGLTNILSTMDSNSETEQKSDVSPGLDSEISMVVESEHPYEGAKQRCFKCVLPENVSFIVLEFDKQCQSAQSEDYVEIFSGDEMSTKIFTRYYQDKWPSSTLMVPGHRVRIEFNSVSDYNDVKRQDERWGFRATVKGYITPSALPCSWMIDLEKQVGYLGALCASRLIASEEPTEQERKIAHVLRSKVLQKGIASQYLHTEGGKLEFVPKSRYDRFLAKLVAEPPSNNGDGDKEDGKDDEKGDGIEMAESGPHLLVDWMRRQRGGVEQLKSTAIGDGINKDKMDEKWVGWVSGFPRSFRVSTCDEFGIGLDYGGARIKIEVTRGSVFGKECGESTDFSGHLDIIDDTEKHAVPYSKVSQLTCCKSNDDKHVYLFGGYQPDNKESRRVVKYNITTEEYTDVADMPGTLRGGEAVAIGDHKIALAGTYPTGDSLWVYDEDKDTWETIKKPEKTGWEASIAMDNNGYLHVIGGLQGHSNHLRYDFNKKEWEKMNGFPEPRICGGMVCDPDGVLYLFGGTNSKENNNVSDKMYTYDADKDEWTVKCTLPRPLVQFAYAVTNSQIIVFGGGEKYGNDVAPQYDTIYVYDFEGNQKWIKSEHVLPKKNREFVACFIGGEIHLFGGSSDSKKQNWHFIVRAPATQNGQKTIRQIAGKSPKEPVDFDEAIITDFEDGSYEVETTINESGLFYLRVLVNDHPILGSPFKVHVESSFNDAIQWGEQTIHTDDWMGDRDVYYVTQNLKEPWRDTPYALGKRKSVSLNIKPTKSDFVHHQRCTVFIPTNVWDSSKLPKTADSIHCVLTNEDKTSYKAVQLMKIDDEIEEKKEDDEEEEEEEKEDKERFKTICYFSRDLEKYFEFGLPDQEWKVQPIVETAPQDSDAAKQDTDTDKEKQNDDDKKEKDKEKEKEKVKEDEDKDTDKDKEKENEQAKEKAEVKEDEDDEDEEDKPDPMEPQSFFICPHTDAKRSPMPIIKTLIYSGKSEDEWWTKYKLPITNGHIAMDKYQIIEIRDEEDLILPFGVINTSTEIKQDASRSHLSIQEDSCSTFAIMDCMALEPILVKEKTEKKEELEIIAEEKKSTLPEWFLSLRSIQPGFPMKLYAIAYREKEKNMEQAVNWLLDKGQAYIAEHVKEFEDTGTDTWQCNFCTFINKGLGSNCEMCQGAKPEEVPDYLNANHKFWSKEEEKANEEDDKDKEEDSIEEILFGGVPYSGSEILAESKVLEKPFKLQLLVLPKPVAYSPSANTPAARRAVRYVFAALLRHHGVVSEAITCVNFLETFGALTVEKSSHPLLNELARLWDVALALKHELAAQYDDEIANKESASKSGSEKQYKTLGDAIKPNIQKDLAQRSEDELRRELTKFKVESSANASTREEMEKKLVELRLDLAIRGTRCCCGARMVRMVARDIYPGGSVVCDLCRGGIRGTLLAFHCPEKRVMHEGGYDVCVDCVNKTWEMDVKDTKSDDPYGALSQIVVDKVTLLFQLYPANKDFGLNIHALIGAPPKVATSGVYDEPVSAPAVRFDDASGAPHPHVLLRAISAETKQDDHAFLADAFPMGLMTRHKSETNVAPSPFGLLSRAKSTPSIGAAGLGDQMFGDSEERSESRLRLSRVPDECESNQITQMIMYIMRKDIPPRVVRNALSERRLRAKQRIMGFRLFTSLFNNTSSHALHQDFAWLLASAIRQCVFEKIEDPKLGPSKKKKKGKKKEEEEKDKEKKENDDVDDEEWLQNEEEDSDLDEEEIEARRAARKKRIDARKKRRKKDGKKKEQQEIEPELKWKRDIWRDDIIEGQKIIHYLRGIEGSGPKLSNLTRSAFQKLYTKLTAIFRADSSRELNMGALGFLESWSIHFGVDDHAFLHDSQIFPVIRSLMSRSHELKEDEEVRSNIAVFAPTNLTGLAEIVASTAQHRVNYIVDESTETFWQSAVNADNDQFNYNQVHATHWIQLKFASAVAVKEVVLSLDSERDREYIPKSIEVYCGESADENELIGCVEVEKKFSGWLSIKMRQCCPSKCQAESGCIVSNFFWLKVPSIQDGQYEMRLRQLIVYGVDVKQSVRPDSYDEKLQRVQNGALDLFRRLVSRTFVPTTIRAAAAADIDSDEDIKEEVKEEDIVVAIDDGIDDDDDEEDIAVPPPKPGLLRQKTTEVQEEMVGILAFMGDQGQKVGNLQRLVFELIFSEIGKEIARATRNGKCFYDLDSEDPDMPPPQRMQLRVDKSAQCLADNYCFEMFCMILDLVCAKGGQKFIASPLLISRLFEIFPRSSTRMQDVLISIFVATFEYIKPNVIRQFGYSDASARKYDNLCDFFLFCIASSLSSTVRRRNKQFSELSFLHWMSPLEATQSKSLVQMFRTIIANESIWKQIILQRLIHHVLELRHMSEEDIECCDEYWLIAASLCVIAGDTGQSHLDILAFDSASPYHIDYREGTATIKILRNGQPRMIMVADLTQCKSLITFKRIKTDDCGATCRFCDTQIEADGNVCCRDEFCQNAAQSVCQKRLACGHLCCGIRDEETCLPCLSADCSAHVAAEMKEDRDTYCNICYTDTLAAQATILLESCGHAFHYLCCHKMLELRWNGVRITFGFRGCPLCKKVMRHSAGLGKLNGDLDKLYEAVKAKSLMRLQYEKLDSHADIVNKTGRFYANPAGFAMNKYAYYMCYKCSQPYYGGEAACAAAQGAKPNFDASELLCPSCSPIRVEDCPKHGKDYIEFKCRYCCTIAVWFCFGTTHFCEPCHNNNSKLTSAKKEDLVQCPCKPKDRYGMPEKLKDTKQCPLGLKHPQHGEEFCLGCGLCRNKDF